ncbi:hypothetical protein V490_04350 [Pseudogymnoascus sp. VKM F-3557]|nr:hypothetical protein V490_04350 [Pseudogymnoascus sp. VKM F-3557]
MDPGTVLAITSLGFQVFAGCIRGFVLESTAQNLGPDASLLRTQLGLAEWHFMQWAEKVGLISKDRKFKSAKVEEMNPKNQRENGAEVDGLIGVVVSEG